MSQFLFIFLESSCRTAKAFLGSRLSKSISNTNVSEEFRSSVCHFLNPGYFLFTRNLRGKLSISNQPLYSIFTYLETFLEASLKRRSGTMRIDKHRTRPYHRNSINMYFWLKWLLYSEHNMWVISEDPVLLPTLREHDTTLGKTSQNGFVWFVTVSWTM